MTDKLPVYTVNVSREDDLWVAVVEGLPAGATDVERFEDLPDAVSDLIATLLDTEPENFWIDWHYRQDGHDLTDLIGHLREWEDLAERAATYRDASRKAVVDAMREAGLSYREIADVIGTSYQRVGQLLSDSGTDFSFPLRETTAIIQAKWTKSLRNTVVHGGQNEDAETVSPYEGVVIALLDSARRFRPESRNSVLYITASVLEEAAKDADFLRWTYPTFSKDLHGRSREGRARGKHTSK